MKIGTSITLLLVLPLIACDDRAHRLAELAAGCELAERVGDLHGAEDVCQRALGNADEDVLDPQVKSERLYTLGRVKRQRGKYSQADELLRQSLAIEERLSGPDSPAVGRRLFELSLILAGRGQWQEGAGVLERTIPLASQLTEKEQAAMANILARYSVQLRKTPYRGQAARFAAAATELKSSK